MIFVLMGFNMISKTGIWKNLGYRGVPEKHDIRKITQNLRSSGGPRNSKALWYPEKMGHLKNLGHRGVPEKHDMQKQGIFEKCGGTRKFERNDDSQKRLDIWKIGGTEQSWRNMIFKKTGHWWNSGVPINLKNLWCLEKRDLRNFRPHIRSRINAHIRSHINAHVRSH